MGRGQGQEQANATKLLYGSRLEKADQSFLITDYDQPFFGLNAQTFLDFLDQENPLKPVGFYSLNARLPEIPCTWTKVRLGKQVTSDFVYICLEIAPSRKLSSTVELAKEIRAALSDEKTPLEKIEVRVNDERYPRLRRVSSYAQASWKNKACLGLGTP